MAQQRTQGSAYSVRELIFSFWLFPINDRIQFSLVLDLQLTRKWWGVKQIAWQLFTWLLEYTWFNMSLCFDGAGLAEPSYGLKKKRNKWSEPLESGWFLTKFNIFICFFFQISHFGPWSNCLFTLYPPLIIYWEIHDGDTSFRHCEELKHTSNALLASIQAEKLKHIAHS